MTTAHLASIVLGALLLPHAATADEGLRANLLRCAAIPADAARLRCYDETARGAAAAERGPAPANGPSEIRPGSAAAGVSKDRREEVPEDATAAAAPEALNDAVGKKAAAAAEQKKTWVGKLVRCEESGPSDRTYFYLDGGQVWRQAGGGRLRFRNCDSDVEISEDWIGFRLYIASRNRTVRVSRVR